MINLLPTPPPPPSPKKSQMVRYLLRLLLDMIIHFIQQCPSVFPLQDFTGNTNANEMVKSDLNRPITAHFIRFVPVEWNYKPCMRVEVYGTAIGKVKTCALPPKEIVRFFFNCVVF